MAPEGQKRFRKRGGAKKNKNKKRNQGTNSSAFDEHPPKAPSTPYPQENDSFHIAGNPFQEASDTALDASLQAYLTKLANDLTLLESDPHPTSQWDDDDDPPPAVLLARNALTELTPRAQEIVRDGAASHLIETLLQTASHPPAAAALLNALVAQGPSRTADLVAHRAASHVFEAVLNALQPVNEGDEPVLDAMTALAETCAEWTGNNLGDIMHNSSGSHSFRAIVAALSGLPIDEPREAKLDDTVRGRIRSYMDQRGVEVPQAWGIAVCKMGHALVDDVGEGLKQFAWSPAPSAALQGLLSGIAVCDKELAGQLATKVVDSQVDKLMRNACGGRFVERAIVCLGAAFVENQYKGRLRELADDPRANYCVQRILLGLRGRGAVMNAWDELEESIPQMLGYGRGREGVVLSLLRATEAEGDDNARRRASRCVARSCGALGSKATIFVGVLAMGSEDVWNTWRNRVSELGRVGLGIRGERNSSLQVPRGVPNPRLLGILIARCIMRYPGGPGQSIRDSMAVLSDVEILALIANPIGSRLVEQWVDAETSTASGKIAGKVMRAITGDANVNAGVLAVAKNSYGAQLLVKCSALLAAPQRKILMDALASDIDCLKKHDCGEMVLRKCRVEQYMKRGEEWEHEETTRERRERMFADILEEGDQDRHHKNAGPLREEKKKGGDRSTVSKKRKRKEASELSVADKKTGAAPLIFDALLSTKDSESPEVTGPQSADVKKDEKGSLDTVLGAITSAATATKTENETLPKKKKRKKKHRPGRQLLDVGAK